MFSHITILVKLKRNKEIYIYKKKEEKRKKQSTINLNLVDALTYYIFLFYCISSPLTVTFKIKRINK